MKDKRNDHQEKYDSVAFDIIESMTEHIAIITVVYNNYEVLNDFLRSLREQINQSYHLFIADASDNKKPIDTHDIYAIVLPIKNHGYAYGVNAGLETAIKNNIHTYCIINDDVFFQPDFVETLKMSFKTHPKSLIGGKIYYAPGYEFHKEKYQKSDLGNVLWYAGGSVDWDHALIKHRGVDEVDSGKYESVERASFITGCLTCFDKSVIDTVGSWDIKYFLYYEDADFCERAKRKNIPLVFDPTLKIWHKNAQSTEGAGSAIHQRFQKQGRLRFAMKYAPWRTKMHIVKNYFLNRL